LKSPRAPRAPDGSTAPTAPGWWPPHLSAFRRSLTTLGVDLRISRRGRTSLCFSRVVVLRRSLGRGPASPPRNQRPRTTCGVGLADLTHELDAHLRHNRRAAPKSGREDVPPTPRSPGEGAVVGVRRRPMQVPGQAHFSGLWAAASRLVPAVCARFASTFCLFNWEMIFPALTFAGRHGGRGRCRTCDPSLVRRVLSR
jgi:hypothetical protein